MRVNQWIWLVLLPVVAGCEGDDSESGVVAELQQYTIVFARNDTPLNASGGTKRSLYSMRGDGSNVTDLSRHPSGGYPSGSPGYDRLPTYSPSASYILFQSTREGNEEVYRMNPDGSSAIDLTAWQDHDEDFGISPDGLKIAFARLTSGVYQVWTMGSDGTQQRRVAGTTEDARYPYWSPDGSKLVFSQRVTAGSGVYWRVMTANADGSNPQKLTDSTESAVYPRWSKDGQRIFYDVVGSGMAYRDISGTGRGSLAQVSGLYLSYPIHDFRASLDRQGFESVLPVQCRWRSALVVFRREMDCIPSRSSGWSKQPLCGSPGWERRETDYHKSVWGSEPGMDAVIVFRST
jgi:hypothetical protein